MRFQRLLIVTGALIAATAFAERQAGRHSAAAPSQATTSPANHGQAGDPTQFEQDLRLEEVGRILLEKASEFQQQIQDLNSSIKSDAPKLAELKKKIALLQNKGGLIGYAERQSEIKKLYDEAEPFNAAIKKRDSLKYAYENFIDDSTLEASRWNNYIRRKYLPYDQKTLTTARIDDSTFEKMSKELVPVGLYADSLEGQGLPNIMIGAIYGGVRGEVHIRTSSSNIINDWDEINHHRWLNELSRRKK